MVGSMEQKAFRCSPSSARWHNKQERKLGIHLRRSFWIARNLPRRAFIPKFCISFPLDIQPSSPPRLQPAIQLTKLLNHRNSFRSSNEADEHLNGISFAYLQFFFRKIKVQLFIVPPKIDFKLLLKSLNFPIGRRRRTSSPISDALRRRKLCAMNKSARFRARI